MTIHHLEQLQAAGKIRGYKASAGKVDKAKVSKYRNKKVEYDGMVFDSKKELTRWIELKQWERLGIISDLKRQVVFQLSVCKYIADHTYFQDGIYIVEDVKSAITQKLPAFILKKKMMKNELLISIKIV